MRKTTGSELPSLLRSIVPDMRDSFTSDFSAGCNADVAFGSTNLSVLNPI